MRNVVVRSECGWLLSRAVVLKALRALMADVPTRKFDEKVI